jgi:hypothetical protein
MKNKSSAKKLGYYLFWNIRSQGLAVTSQDLQEVAMRSGLRHQETARKLFDRNEDDFITMDEIITSVEQVYNNRKYLTRSIKDSHTGTALQPGQRPLCCPPVSLTLNRCFNHRCWLMLVGCQPRTFRLRA